MSTCVGDDTRLYKMRRLITLSQNHEDLGGENISTTPLRTNIVRLPRLRLLDKDFGTDGITGSKINHYQSNAIKPALRTMKIYSFTPPVRSYSEDRFIRCSFNADASHFLLTKKSDNTQKANEIDVFKQVISLSVNWRKKLMHQLLLQSEVIPGLRQKNILGGNELHLDDKVSGSVAGITREVWDEQYCEDGIWKCKPRRRPLISTTEAVLDMSGFHAVSRYRSRLIDWSSKNVIAAVMQNMVTFYDTLLPEAAKPLAHVEVFNVCALKWNHAGNKVVICTLASEINLYCVTTEKMLWTNVCKSMRKYNLQCYVRCICWSQNDKHVVTGCGGLISVYAAKSGKFVKSGCAHTRGLLALAFSLTYQYLASSSLDKFVRLFEWPGLIPLLDINYNQSIKALAWHPYESGLLCIGGGLGDASLSLWNINKLCPVTYRHVQFHGIVENLAWNKHSAELVVHWIYWERQKQYNVIPVLASLDRIVDVLPVNKESRINSIMWNSGHTQLATQCSDSLLMWNFFGNAYSHFQETSKPNKDQVVKRNSVLTTINALRHFRVR